MFSKLAAVMTSKFLLVIIKQQLPVNIFVTIIYHQGLAIHHPSYRPVISTPIHLLILSGISYTERLRAQSTALKQLTRLLLCRDSFSFGDAEA